MQTKRKRNSAAAKTIAAPADQAEDAPPVDMERFRLMLAQRMAMAIANRGRCWRHCRVSLCRGQRACAAPEIHCSNAPPAPPATPDEIARTLALLQRALNERLAQIEGEGK
jgi:hypothetical protein